LLPHSKVRLPLTVGFTAKQTDKKICSNLGNAVVAAKEASASTRLDMFGAKSYADDASGYPPQIRPLTEKL
jgi:hypothetical protein